MTDRRQPTTPLVALSLGWGVQSFTLAAMAALGEIEMPDVAIHANTTHEASGTYAFARQWTFWLEERGIRVITVTPVSKRLNPRDTYGTIVIPAYTASSAAGGVLRRQCTNEWKIAPMRRWLQANRDGRSVEQWIGISLDEYQRMKDSHVQYVTNRWPLVERRVTRNDCARWLERHNLPIPPKSACVFCPFHDARAWHDLKASGNGDWQKAVEVDEQIRKVLPPYDLFVHPSRQPLAEVDLSNAEERGQLNLWNDECTGICGV